MNRPRITNPPISHRQMHRETQPRLRYSTVAVRYKSGLGRGLADHVQVEERGPDQTNLYVLSNELITLFEMNETRYYQCLVLGQNRRKISMH